MKDYKQIWNNLSTTYADAGHFVGYSDDEQEIRQNGTLTATFLREVLEIGKDDRVLEIGCGVARIGRELAPFCKEWHGTDISGNMIEHARQRTQDVPNIFLHELPESSLDIFADNYFDCVYSSIVFMHLDKVEVFRYVRDAFRVLAPGGRAYFDTFNLLAPEAWKQFADIVENYPAGRRPGHVSQFSTPQELEKYLEEAEFSDIHIDAQNTTLVLGLGRKPSSSNGERPTSPLRRIPNLASHGLPAENSLEVNESYREWKVITDNLRTKDAYIARIEAALTEKNAHIEELERQIKRQNKSLSKRLVRLAARLSR